MRDNPLTAELVARIGLNGVHVFAAQDRRLVMYPCRRGELLNVGGIFPSASKTETGNDAVWHNAGSVGQLLETFHEFGEELQEMCRMAEDVKLWTLASRDPAPIFFRGKLAVIGDAAHPMLPRMFLGLVSRLMMLKC
jgi:salicylate hydroxylase